MEYHLASLVWNRAATHGCQVTEIVLGNGDILGEGVNKSPAPYDEVKEVGKVSLVKLLAEIVSPDDEAIKTPSP